MPLLAGTFYDPSSAVSKATTAALAMTAFDTTNLRLTFTAPSSGIVQVRISCCIHGAASPPQILLGVLDGSTVRGRISPIGGMHSTNTSTAHTTMEGVFLVTGLTGGNSYTFDAAYGVESATASTNIKYGGPNDTTGNNAFGGISFEIWDVPNLLAGKLYDPSTAVLTSNGTATVMTALDTTNLRLTFTAPSSGIVMVRLHVTMAGATTFTQALLGVLESTTVRGRMAPIGAIRGATAGITHVPLEAVFLVTGLTGGNSYTFDAAWAVETAVATSNLKYGGPNDTTADNAWGGFAYEIWDIAA